MESPWKCDRLSHHVFSPPEGTPFSSKGKAPHSHPWQLLEVVKNNLHGHWTSLVLAHYFYVSGCFLSEHETAGFDFLLFFDPPCILWRTCSYSYYFHALLFCVMNWLIHTLGIRYRIFQGFDQMPLPKEYLWIPGRHAFSSEKGKCKRA